MGKRSFVCRSSLGGQLSLHVHTTIFSFWLFVVLCLCCGLWGYCLSPKYICFQNDLCLRHCEPSEIYVSLSFLYKCDTVLGLYLCSCWYFLHISVSGISVEDAVCVKYLSCTICIFLRHTGKYDMFSGQTSNIVWCYIFRLSRSFNQHGEWNLTVVLTFLFYILHLTDSYTEMQMILFIDYSWIFVSFSICNFYSLYMLSLTHRYGS